MSVLPKSASFASFFIVFSTLFLFTILLALNLSTFYAKIAPLFRRPKLQLDLLSKLLLWTNCIGTYISLLANLSSYGPWEFFETLIDKQTGLRWWLHALLYELARDYHVTTES